MDTMARIVFIISLMLLKSADLLMTMNNWNCKEGDINIALIFDCRYNLQLQLDFFNQFLSNFEPVAVSDKNKPKILTFVFNLLLMTYSHDKMITFETLTRQNFTTSTFIASLSQINSSSCPEHLPIKNIFNETRDVFIGKGYIHRRVAIFLLDQIITDQMSDYATSRWLENEQNLNSDVRRLFVIINPVVRLAERGLNIIHTNTLNNTNDVVEKSISLICNHCNSKYRGYWMDRSCYFVLELNKEMTREEGSELCGNTWFRSHLVNLNSQRELEYVTSVLEEHFRYVAYEKENCVTWSLDRCYCLPQLMYGRASGGSYVRLPCRRFRLYTNNNLLRFSLAFTGLKARWSNYGVEYVWDDDTHYSLEADLPSYVTGKNCYYLTQNYSRERSNGFIISHSYWSNYDCDKAIKTDILLCESAFSDIYMKRIILKAQGTYNQVINTTFLFLFLTLNGNEVQDSAISITKQNINFTIITQTEHIRNCNTSKDLVIANRNQNESMNHTIHSVNLVTSVANDFKERNVSLSHTLVCSLIGHSEMLKTTSEDTSTDVRYIRALNSTLFPCLYKTGPNWEKARLSKNKLLQNCEHFVCPLGFAKCPDSYCIPAYLVHDGTKDCPHGEDEEPDNAKTVLCRGKFKFTLTPICLQNLMCKANINCLKYMHDFVCQSSCTDGYVCISHTLRNDSDTNSLYTVRVVETTVELYEDTRSFYFSPQVYFLFTLFKLVEINLSQCRIKNLDDVMNSLDSAAVLNLDISQNDLSRTNNFSAILKMKNLQALNISYNRNIELEANVKFPLTLQAVDLSYTKCGNEFIKYLGNLSQLRILELRHVEPIDLGKMSGHVQLDIMDVRGTQIVNLKEDYLAWLTIRKALYTDDFKLCCDAIRGIFIPAGACHAPRDAISTCQDMIGDPLKRVILWVVGVFSLLGNIAVVIYRLLWDRAVCKKAYGLFVVCLGVSDLIMGVYLLIVACTDMVYRNLYVLKDVYWRHSDMCQLAGILSTFSSETSTMFICLITLDRFLVIRYPFGQHRFSKTGKITSISLTMIICVVVSVIPAVFPGWEIYSSNGMCLALPFSARRHRGWEYSAALFVGLNFFLFILIAIGQLSIFRAIHQKQSTVLNRRDSLRRAQDFAVAKQLFLVAMSDFCCWFPIGIMGIMSLNGYNFHPDVYAWSAVLILPINSAINPLIYTFPQIWRNIKFHNL